MKEGKLGWSGLILLVRGSLAQSEDPRVNPTRGAPKFHFWFYVWATRQKARKGRGYRKRRVLGAEPAADGAPGCGVIADYAEGGGDGDGED